MGPILKIQNHENKEEDAHLFFLKDLEAALEYYAEKFGYEEWTMHVTKYKHHMEINDMQVWDFNGEMKICSLFWGSKILVFSEGTTIKLYVTKNDNEKYISVGFNGSFTELRTFIRKYVKFTKGKYSKVIFYDWPFLFPKHWIFVRGIKIDYLIFITQYVFAFYAYFTILIIFAGEYPDQQEGK